jgi:hypothetical protein
MELRVGDESMNEACTDTGESSHFVWRNSTKFFSLRPLALLASPVRAGGLAGIFGAFFLMQSCFAPVGWTPSCRAQDEGWLELPKIQERVEKALAVPENCKKMVEEGRVWIHRDEQAVIVDGYVCQRNAPLEMFACPVGSKEHEAVVALFAKSRFVHASLLAVGGVPGKPVSFEPKFVAASGTTVRVYVLWHNEKGETQGTLAQHWIRKVGTKQPMEWDWVFAGSKIYKDPDTGKETYMGDSGDLICVANFMTSTLDVSVKSDAANSGLVFEAFTEKIPKRYTPIRLVLVLSDEPPYSSEGGDKNDSSDTNRENSDALPKHLKAEVPKRVLEFLPAASASQPEETKDVKPKEKPIPTSR